MKERNRHFTERKTLAQKAVVIFDRLRNKSLPDGNALCYPGEKDGHGQDLEVTPQDQEIVLLTSAAAKIVWRQNGK